MRLSPYLLLLMLFSACDAIVEDFTRVDAVDQRAEYAVPLIDSRTGLQGLVGRVDERVDLVVGQDGLLSFVYRDTVPPITSEEVFDQLRDIGQALPFGITDRNTTISFPNPQDVVVNELRITGGAFVYRFPNTYDRAVRIEFILPNATRGGEPLTVTGELPAYDGSGEPPTLTNLDDPLGFGGYVLDASSDLELIYRIDAADDGTPLQPAEETVAAFRDLDFSYVEGSFGATPYPGVSDRLEIDFWERYRSGEVSFVDPLIRVRVSNSFGLPARAVVEELDITTVEGETVAVTGRVVEEGFDFNFPTEEGEMATTTYLIDDDNSNLSELLSARPVALNYQISALVNPEGDTGVVGFLTDTSSYTAILELELPLYASASNFRVVDSFPINLGQDYGNITAATLRLTTDNELPFDLSLEGTFTDSLGNPLLDLTDGELLVIEAAPVDAEGRPTDTRSLTTDLTFADERLERLRRASQLILTAGFATTDGGDRSVRITGEQELRVRLGARLRVENP